MSSHYSHEAQEIEIFNTPSEGTQCCSSVVEFLMFFSSTGLHEHNSTYFLRSLGWRLHQCELIQKRLCGKPSVRAFRTGNKEHSRNLMIWECYIKPGTTPGSTQPYCLVCSLASSYEKLKDGQLPVSVAAYHRAYLSISCLCRQVHKPSLFSPIPCNFFNHLIVFSTTENIVNNRLSALLSRQSEAKCPARDPTLTWLTQNHAGVIPEKY